MVGTQLYILLSHRLVHTTTCFGPVYWPSSGCIINLIRSYTIYIVRQFNSRNGPVKAKFAYLYTNCRNRFENRFPEYLAETFSRCVGCQQGQQIFVPFGKSQKSQGA